MFNKQIMYQPKTSNKHRLSKSEDPCLSYEITTNTLTNTRSNSLFDDNDDPDQAAIDIKPVAIGDDDNDDSSGNSVEKRKPRVGNSEHIQEEFNILTRNKAVTRVKLIVVLMLLCATVVVTALIYHFTKTDEVNDYNHQYEIFANKIIESFSHNMDMKVYTAYTFASVFTSRFSSGSSGDDSNIIRTSSSPKTMWPNVSMSDFHEQATGTVLLAHAQSVYFAPMLTNDTIAPWMDYEASFRKKNMFHGNHQQEHIFTLNSTGGKTAQTRGQSRYFPVWQHSPEEGYSDAFLFDEYSERVRRAALNNMLMTKQPTLTEMLYQDVDYHEGDHHKEPNSILFSPIFDGFSEASEVVGVIGIFFQWRMNFANVLSDNAQGLCLVLESSNGKKMTYLIDGSDATFVGAGDLHEAEFDNKVTVFTWSPQVTHMTAGDGHDHRRHLQHMNDNSSEHSNDMNQDSGEHMNDDSSEHSGKMNQDFGEEGTHGDMHHNDAKPEKFTIRVYSSTQFRSAYMTKKPVIFCSAVALIFFFTSMTFIVYDCLVENRQAVVMKKAVETSKIVHSLFPAMVRDRLFNHDEGESTPILDIEKGPKLTSHLAESPAHRLRSFLLNGIGNKPCDLSTGSQGHVIADMFPETTIMFADIVGFTAWSSERDPSQVFELLEKVYGEYDLEAKRQGVFKIETIGDCYVAVTGLPEPMPKHAVAMARFAQQILIKFHDMTKELELSLGPGTTELGLRIGIHSGAVTGGVLRGEKSRFQLFGDTMNTASRMESTSMKNMIQVSPESAKLIEEDGKSCWLVPRADIVTAKGKGEIQSKCPLMLAVSECIKNTCF